MKILIYMVGMLLFFGCDPSGGDPSGFAPLPMAPLPMAVDYEASGVQFRMREIPAGDGVASFLMAETEVTQELYEAVMGSNPSYFTGDDQRPVERVSWEDAIVFCNTLSGLLNPIGRCQVTGL